MSCKISTDVIDGAISRMTSGQEIYSCHAIKDALYNSDDVSIYDLDDYLVAYTKFSGAQLGVPVDYENLKSLSAFHGDSWQWWCSFSPEWRDAKVENLRKFKQAIEKGEIK